MSSIVAAALVAFGGAASAQLVDGSFEARAGDAPAARYATTTLGPGWTVAFGNVDLVGAGEGSPQLQALMSHPSRSGGGLLALDLNGLVPAMVQQVIATTVGQVYGVSFLYAANPGTTGGDVNLSSTFQFNVTPTGGTGGVSTFALTGKRGNWDTFDDTFTATSTLTTLQFISTDYTGNAGYGAMLDRVAVSPVPEPGTLALAAVGLGVVGWARRRGRRGG